MTEDEQMSIPHNTPRRRAAQARRRADAAQTRILELRDRRLGTAESTAEQRSEDLRYALAHARQAHEYLLSALESSALAHERASDAFFAKANGDPELEAKARNHLVRAAADRERASDLRNS
jgi:hypothetical protein